MTGIVYDPELLEDLRNPDEENNIDSSLLKLLEKEEEIYFKELEAHQFY
jgi:hypothetical protein